VNLKETAEETLQVMKPLPLAQSTAERLAEVEVLARATDSLCRTGEQLKKLAPLGVSEHVAAIVYPSSIVGAAQLVHRLSQAGLRWRGVGQGTGFYSAYGLHDFVAVSLRLLDERVVVDGERIRVHAGHSLAALVRTAAESGLSGLEGMAGLPGSVGGALSSPNSLAIRYLWNLIEEVVVADRGGLVVITLNDAAESELFDPQDLILAITLKLKPGDAAEIITESERCWHARITAAPYNATLMSKANGQAALDKQPSGLWHRLAVAEQPEASAVGDSFGLVELIRERVEQELKQQLTQVIRQREGFNGGN
jgi:UDP-N-acetylmuramate dehydrogenase